MLAILGLLSTLWWHLPWLLGHTGSWWDNFGPHWWCNFNPIWSRLCLLELQFNFFERQTLDIDFTFFERRFNFFFTDETNTGCTDFSLSFWSEYWADWMQIRLLYVVLTTLIWIWILGFTTFYWADWFQLLSDEPNTAYSNRLLYVVFIQCWANRLLYVVLAGYLDTGSWYILGSDTSYFLIERRILVPEWNTMSAEYWFRNEILWAPNTGFGSYFKFLARLLYVVFVQSWSEYWAHDLLFLTGCALDTGSWWADSW